jgi:large subunit ribosomal protein L10
MNREQKAAVIEEIASQLSAAQAVFAVDYRGLTVTQAAELRAKLRDANTAFRVVKNSLTERAADKAGAESLKALLEGPTALALVEGDAALAAKALSDTARTLRLLEFKGGVMDGNALSAEDVRAIARLPAREVLHGQLVGVVAAPLSGLARTLNALLAGVAVALQQVVDQGLVGGGESPAPADPSDQAPAAPSDAVPPTEQSESDERPAEAGE